jgi:hypothetical protein
MVVVHIWMPYRQLYTWRDQKYIREITNGGNQVAVESHWFSSGAGQHNQKREAAASHISTQLSSFSTTSNFHNSHSFRRLMSNTPPPAETNKITPNVLIVSTLVCTHLRKPQKIVSFPVGGGPADGQEHTDYKIPFIFSSH